MRKAGATKSCRETREGFGWKAGGEGLGWDGGLREETPAHISGGLEATQWEIDLQEQKG